MKGSQKPVCSEIRRVVWLCAGFQFILLRKEFQRITWYYDWFGINHIVCSPSTADIFNPKVVQASMGAVGRVRVHYIDLEAFLASQEKQEVPVYGTFLDGENIFKSTLTSHGVIVLGNEGKGIHNEYVLWINRKITIPDFHSGSHKPDSLNVSIAASIVISEFRRRTLFI
jgi:RNA methyltransferase, TrmH family